MFDSDGNWVPAHSGLSLLPDGTAWPPVIDPTTNEAPRKSKLAGQLKTKILKQPSPCEGCKYESWCRLHPVACRDFLHWVATGKVKHTWRAPRATIYERIYSEDEEE